MRLSILGRCFADGMKFWDIVGSIIVICFSDLACFYCRLL